MNQEKIGKIIKKIRKDNNLSQKEFGDKYGITYQAVSKWENGKNIPDIAILKEICKDYNLKIDDLLDNNTSNKKKYYIIFIVVFIILVISTISIVYIIKHNDFEFKTISSSCNDFKLVGSIAYNKSKSSIYINNITYCGDKEYTKYDEISCTLFESSGNSIQVISSYEYVDKKRISLDEFLNNLSFKIDDYEQVCKNFKKDSLYLEITAKNNGEITMHKIPLVLDDNC